MSAFKGLAAVSLLSGLLGLQAAAFADDPPKLDVTTTCNGSAQFAITVGRDKEACMEDERQAETTLAQNWSKYSADDRTQCTGTVKTGGPASYVELLSCLEVMRDAKEFREGDQHPPSDQPSPSTRRRRR